MRHVGVCDRSVTAYAVSADHGNDCRLGTRLVRGANREEQAVGGMAGGAGVMNLIVGSAHRYAGCRAGRGRMAARACR